METVVKYFKDFGWVAGFYNNGIFERLPMSKNSWKTSSGAKKWIEKNIYNATITIE